MDLFLNQVLPESLRQWSSHHDYIGQKRSERYLQGIILVHGVVGFLAGLFFERISFMIYTILFGAAVAAVVVLPPWPIFRNHPLNWQLKSVENDKSVGSAVNDNGAKSGTEEKTKKNTKKQK